MDLIYLALSKNCDTMLHQKLLAKLEWIENQNYCHEGVKWTKRQTTVDYIEK